VRAEPPTPSNLPVSAVVLAGGASSRMGRDKAWLELDGIPLVRLAVEKIRSVGIAEIFISGREDGDYSALNCPVLRDLEPGFGPLGGIERALHACTSPLLLVLAVDMPHLTPAWLCQLIRHCDPLTGALPKLAGHLEPLAAIYPKRCHAYAYDAVIKSRHTVRDFAAACQREHAVRILTVSEADAGCFANWNTPADLAPAK
jgi:molybdenum cofactor guanylyltransferase